MKLPDFFTLKIRELYSYEENLVNLLNIVFQGKYSYERVISSPQLTSQGIASFSQTSIPIAHHLDTLSDIGIQETNILKNQKIYTEQGIYYLNGKEQLYYQKRFFVIEASRLCIYKSDHNLLHEFAIDKAIGFPFQLTHSHSCDNDHYSVTITIHSTDSFSISYFIQGPSKDYKIDTVFNRKIMFENEGIPPST